MGSFWMALALPLPLQWRSHLSEAAILVTLVALGKAGRVFSRVDRRSVMADQGLAARGTASLRLGQWEGRSNPDKGVDGWF